MKNNKGFTMVELLVTIVILGILSVVLIISMNSVLSSGRSSYYSSQENLIILAGKDYFTTNKNKLPEGIGESEIVYLKTLIDLKYIDPVLDRNKNNCDYDASYVKVTKIAKAKYKYQVYLACPKDNYYGKEPTVESGNGNITYTSDPVSGISDTKVVVTLKTSGDVSSYDYKVIKLSDNSIYSRKDNETKSQLKFEFTEEGKYQITTDVKVAGREKQTVVSGIYIVDRTKPTCGTATSTDNTWKETNAPWTKNDRSISVVCTDNIGCKKTAFPWDFTTTLDDGYITIEDIAGNKRDCKMSVRVDKIKPTCVSSGGGSNWNSGSVTLTGKCSDDDSKCMNDTVIREFNSNTNASNQSPGQVCDKAGNCVDCPANQTVKLDKENPKCSISVSGTTGNNGWYKSDVTLTLNTSDTGGSQVASYDLTTSASPSYNNSKTKSQSTTNGITYYGYVKDGSGRTGTCSITVKVDKTKPNCTNSNSSNGKWTNKDVVLTGTCNDGSGSGCTGNASKTFSKSTEGEWSNQSPGQVCDKAGNCKDCSTNQSVKIDTTDPKICKYAKDSSGNYPRFCLKSSNAANLTYNGTTYVARWGFAVRDTRSGIDTVTVTTYKSDGTKSMSNTATRNGSKSSDEGIWWKVADGSYEIIVKDQAGNTKTYTDKVSNTKAWEYGYCGKGIKDSDSCH